MSFTLPADGFNQIAMTRYGPILYNRNDEYIGASLARYGEFSRGEAELFEAIVPVGGLVVEGGANIGAHTVGLSRRVGPTGTVLAFEPQRLVFQALCANLALNSCANVHALHCGVGETSGAITVPFLPPDQPFNFGGLSLREATHGEVVALRRIDDIGLGACHVIKLDIEGMEVEALRGAADTVRAHRPILFVENDRQDRSEELVSLILGWNYRIYWHIAPLFQPANFAGNPENIFGDISSFNILCLPAEMNANITGAREITSASSPYARSPFDAPAL
jgi:FkbM family methyltransferase